jgi:hypothetical protein
MKGRYKVTPLILMANERKLSLPWSVVGTVLAAGGGHPSVSPPCDVAFARMDTISLFARALNGHPSTRNTYLIPFWGICILSLANFTTAATWYTAAYILRSQVHKSSSRHLPLSFFFSYYQNRDTVTLALLVKITLYW